MKYFPFEDFEIHTTLTSDEVFYRLRATVDTEGTLLILAKKQFWGDVNRRYFKIHRYTWWYHNFTPVVFGKIQVSGFGSNIRVKMRMPWHSILFYGFILVALWVMYFGGIANLLVQKIQTDVWQIESPLMLLPGAFMFMFAYLISVGSFYNEVRRIKDVLLSLSDANIESVVHYDKIFGITETQIIKLIYILTFVVSVGWIVFQLTQ